jgi:primosomal protein N' (replication factor Y)
LSSTSRAKSPAHPPVSTTTRILHIALPLPLPDPFDYAAPASGDDADPVGRRVRVPFGRGTAFGLVVGTGSSSEHARLKPVEAVLDDAPVFDGELWRSLLWAAAYYHHPIGEVFATALPAALRRGGAIPEIDDPGLALSADGLAVQQAATSRPGPGRDVLELLANGPVPVARVREELGEPGRAAVARLRRRGWVEPCLLPAKPAITRALDGPPLNTQQQAAVDSIANDALRFRPVLLDGVTGSGKTEVYLRLIADALARNRQVLVLVPEIALTPQALKRYRERLGAPVLALHSGLSDRERGRAWAYARSGRPCVVLGTRSAIFSPLPNPGLIVVDEEHDASYKQADGFRYHARDLAMVRAKGMNVPIVLGSATPSLETLALIADGRVERLVLAARAVSRSNPPTLRLFDLRRQRLVGGIALSALTAIADTLDRGEQALVFRNRRGYAPLLTCMACPWHSECPRCDHAMTLHRELSALICHHCGLRRKVPAICPSCASAALDARGIGTERIESELRTHFPQHRVIRIDRDSARSAAQLDTALTGIGRGEPAILVGTQLLAKGHDWPMLTLVVVADADSGLFSPDFRAPERLAQQLTQVAGRAGRGERPGTVIVQTRQPDHPFWARWLDGGHAAVARAELADRQASGLPPFRHQALLAAEARGTDALDAFFEAAMALPDARHEQVERLGPLPAPMPRRAGHDRAQLLLESGARAPLHALLSAWMPGIHALKQARRVRWSLDIDPLDMY